MRRSRSAFSESTSNVYRLYRPSAENSRPHDRLLLQQRTAPSIVHQCLNSSQPDINLCVKYMSSLVMYMVRKVLWQYRWSCATAGVLCIDAVGQASVSRYTENLAGTSHRIWWDSSKIRWNHSHVVQDLGMIHQAAVYGLKICRACTKFQIFVAFK